MATVRSSLETAKEQTVTVIMDKHMSFCILFHWINQILPGDVQLTLSKAFSAPIDVIMVLKGLCCDLLIRLKRNMLVDLIISTSHIISAYLVWTQPILSNLIFSPLVFSHLIFILLLFVQCHWQAGVELLNGDKSSSSVWTPSTDPKTVICCRHEQWHVCLFGSHHSSLSILTCLSFFPFIFSFTFCSLLFLFILISQ